jgi:hypothetical protein
MNENIQKLLYLGVGVFVIVIALTGFFNNETSFNKSRISFQSTLDYENTWIKSVTKMNENPLYLPVGKDKEVIKEGLLYQGSDLKNELICLMTYDSEALIYIEGALINRENMITSLLGMDDVDDYLYIYNHLTNEYKISKL